MSERVTISDVAKEAGVSIMTVSRVINNKGEISDTTRQHVLKVIERLDYRPSSIARSLATKRTGTLGLVVPDIANPFFSDLALGAEDKAYAEGYNIFLCNTKEDSQREVATLESLAEKRVDGLIICGSRLVDDVLRTALEHHPVVVLVNRQLPDYDTGLVCVDDLAGGRMATEHLLQSGHRAIGFLAGPPISYSGRQRAVGYRAAIDAAGLPYNAAWVRHCSSGVVSGREVGTALLTDHPELTALFCYNDLVAVGVLQACADLGHRVPDDVAIVGFDDIFLAALVTPPLTTCHTPRYKLGVQVMDMLLDRIKGCTSDCKEIVVQPKLIVRASAP
jgi:LacI family transcriptional regulator